jgi:hypothetical protein
MERIGELKEIALDLMNQISKLDLSDSKQKVLSNIKTAMELDPLRSLKARSLEALKSLEISKDSKFEIRTKYELLISKVKNLAYYLPAMTEELQTIAYHKRALRKALKKSEFKLATEVFNNMKSLVMEALL